MWLLGMLEKYQPDVVVYERPFCRGLHATRSLWGMAGVVEAVSKPCATVFDVNPQQLKKWAGRGANQKAGTTLRCHELGVVPVDDNHADAVCLAYYALEAMEKERRKRCQ